MDTKQFNCRLSTEVVWLIDEIAKVQASSQASVVTQGVKLMAQRLGIARRVGKALKAKK